MSLPRVLDREPTMADLIGYGRQFYATKNYKVALLFFTKVMTSCACARGVERERCTCKNFEKVAAQGGSIFREAMYTCHCDVGTMFSKCDDVYHIQALDFRAATFEALGELDHAMKDAEWILELAPRLPDGYLRVGKIARLKNNDEYAWKMYTAGIEANKESSVDSSPKLQQHHDARKHVNGCFFKQDPISLPAELVTDIFSYLKWTEILPCLRVCKQWMRTLTSPLHGPLWRNLIFPDKDNYDIKPKGSPYLPLLKKISSWAGNGGFRKIVIPRVLDLTQDEFTLLLKESPSLEHLEVLTLIDLSFPSEEKIWNQLRHVTIDDYFNSLNHNTMDLSGEFPYRFLQNAASSLENLTFTGIPQQWYYSEPLIPHLPKVKCLRIGGWWDNVTLFPMFPLSIAFPRIEQLWIGPQLPNLDMGPVALWRDKWEGVWPHLKVLIFDASSVDDVNKIPVSGLRQLMCLNRGTSLLHLAFIHFYLDSDEQMHDIFGNDHDTLAHSDVARHSDFRNLRSVRSDSGMWILPDRARTLLSNSIEDRQLTSFDIVFPERFVRPLPEDSSVCHLKGYDWLRGSPSIHTLGFFGFLFPLNPQNDEDLPLPQFLATFPNLRTLRLNNFYYRKHQNEFASLILAIMSVTHLKTIWIYQHSFRRRSKAMRKVRMAAQSKGVQISLAGDYGLQQWPMKLGS